LAKTLYILDGHAQIYRAFYAPFRDLTSPSGEPTKATFVFCRMLLNLLRDRRPDFMAMALDVSDKSVFRCRIDKNYKANRDPAPEDLHVQADRIVSVVEAMGIPIFRMEGFEADDLMATIASQVEAEDIETYLVSRDKDLEQLLTSKVHLFDPTKDEVIDVESLRSKKGYEPKQAVEIQTLTGDSTDNIPGVAGIGLKTAAKLIGQYGSAQAVLEHADELTPKMRENVLAFADQLPITRQLVTLRADVPMSFELSDCAVDRIDPARARSIFSELGLSRLIETIDALGDGSAPVRSEGEAAMGGQLLFGDQPPLLGADPPSAVRGTYHLVDTVEKLESFAAELGKQKSFAFDTETTGLRPITDDLVGLSISWKAGEAYYLPVRSATGRVLPADRVTERLKRIFEDQSVAKIGHNIKFDCLALRELGIKVAGVSFDTMIAAFLLEPMGRSYSLDGLAEALFGHTMIPISELIGKGKRQITIDQADPERVSDYAAEDADFTWRIYERLSEQIKGSPVEALFTETEMPLIDVLTEMEASGISLNCALLHELGGRMETRLAELTGEIHEAAGRPFNVDSTKQLAEILYDEQGLPSLKKTKTGRSTDAATLETLVARTNHVIPTLVLEYRSLAKLKGTYVETLPRMIDGKTGRVHATFHQAGVATGRLSSSNPNLQNIPIRTEMGRRIREAFVAGDGNVLLAADYSQVELRILAHYCQDEALIEAFHNGEDIHRSVAAKVNGVDPAEVTAEQRSAAKAVNFGLIYGQGAFGLASSLGIARSDAQTFIDAYFKQYPGIRRFIDQCIEQGRSAGFVETILGRRRPVPELVSRNRQQVQFGERIAVNTVIQGSAADLIKRAMIDIHCDLMVESQPTRMLIQVHDELVFEVQEDAVEHVSGMIREKMVSAMDLAVPLVVDIAWAKTWVKG
jgi:DNA polymerase-1